MQRKFGLQRTRTIKEMKDVHWDIMEYLLEGWKKIDIARALGLSPGMVTQVTLSPLFQQEYGRAKANGDVSVVKQYLQTMAQDAAETVVGLMDSLDEKVRFAAARDVLDRAGVSKELVVRHVDELATESLSDTELVRVLAARIEKRRELDAMDAIDVAGALGDATEPPVLIAVEGSGFSLDMSEEA